MIRLGAIDDDRMLLEALAAWLRAAPDLHLVATAATVAEFLAHSPAVDVVLLDLRLRDHSHPVDNVVALTRAGHRVLVVSTSPERDGVVSTFQAGAEGYLTKDADLPALVQAVHTVAGGGTAYSRELVFAWMRDDRPARPALSPQEVKLLQGYVGGLTLAAAARSIGVQPGTAKNYLERIKTKYRATGRTADTKLHLAERAREDGVPAVSDQRLPAGLPPELGS